MSEALPTSTSISTMNHEYWTYIVASLTGTLYSGMTNNIERRMHEHKSGEFEGFGSKYHCDRLVYLRASTMCAKPSIEKSSSKVGVDLGKSL